MRYFAEFEYNGSRYHGWQNQPNALSVQEVMEHALSLLLHRPTDLTAAGRTDTGVHARMMIAHFDTESAIEDPSLLCFKLNGLLPEDIAIHWIKPVRDDAHARFDARSRTYEYWLMQRKSAFTDKLITRSYFQLDFERMNDACEVLLEEKDFASFCKAHTDVKTTLCDVRRAFWQPAAGMDDTWVFTIEADRFLRNMVRATVGTLIEIGRGKISKDDLRRILQEKSRCSAGQSMPADGLYLTNITYPDDLFQLN